MKKILSASVVTLLFAGLIGLTSCKKDVVVTVNIADQETCLPASGIQWANGNDKTFQIPVSDIQAAFTQAGVDFSLEKIKSSKFKNLKLKVSTTAASFDDISGASVYVKDSAPTTGGNASGLGSQIAYIDNIGNGSTEITLNLTGFELKPLLSSATLYVTIRVYNEASGNAAVCVKLTSGVIELEAQQ